MAEQEIYFIETLGGLYRDVQQKKFFPILNFLLIVYQKVILFQF